MTIENTNSKKKKKKILILNSDIYNCFVGSVVHKKTKNP